MCACECARVYVCLYLCDPSDGDRKDPKHSTILLSNLVISNPIRNNSTLQFYYILKLVYD